MLLPFVQIWTGLSCKALNTPKSNQQNKREDTHFRVLKMLEEQPDMSQRQMAEALGVSLGGVNYCLKALMEKGMIKVNNFRNNDNKLAYSYMLTPKGMSEKTALTARFLKRKMQEYEALKAEIESLQSGLGLWAIWRMLSEGYE